jgi:hypothetical protein
MERILLQARVPATPAREVTMRKILLTAVTVVFLYAIAVDAAPSVSRPAISAAAAQSWAQASQQSNSGQHIQTFLGTITKIGDQFVFSDSVNKASYQLDDQKTASKFDEKIIKVTGTSDSADNLIRVQSIEAATA